MAHFQVWRWHARPITGSLAFTSPGISHPWKVLLPNKMDACIVSYLEVRDVKDTMS